MTITFKKDPDSGETYLDLEDLKDHFEDISIIVYYELVEQDDGSIIISFFDENKNIVKPRELS